MGRAGARGNRDGLVGSVRCALQTIDVLVIYARRRHACSSRGALNCECEPPRDPLLGAVSPIPASASAASNSARAVVVRNATRRRTCEWGAPARKLLAARSKLRLLALNTHTHTHTHPIRICRIKHTHTSHICFTRITHAGLQTALAASRPGCLQWHSFGIVLSAAPRKARAFSTWARAFHGASIAINNSRLIRRIAREQSACVSVSISIASLRSSATAERERERESGNWAVRSSQRT